MKLNERGSTGFLDIPAEEAVMTQEMSDVEKAERTKIGFGGKK
jgi:hypothetical protein